jgi:hypothetical protein
MAPDRARCAGWSSAPSPDYTSVLQRLDQGDKPEAEPVEPSEAASAKSVDDRLIDELVGRAQAEGLQLTGEGGLLQQLTKRLLESAIEGEITNHLDYDKQECLINGPVSLSVVTERAAIRGGCGGEGGGSLLVRASGARSAWSWC